jgi:hypothetical protein
MVTEETRRNVPANVRLGGDYDPGGTEDEHLPKRTGQVKVT